MVAKKTAKSSQMKRNVSKNSNSVRNDLILEQLKHIYSDLPAEKKIICYGMLEEAAFLKSTLEGLRKDIWENGATDEYKNGENQYGKKISASLQSYNQSLKNYYLLMEKIMKMFPLETEQADELLEFMNV